MKYRVNCKRCNGEFDIEIFNAGHGDVEYFYCESCPRVVVIPIYEELVPRGFYDSPYDYQLPRNPTEEDLVKRRQALQRRIQAILQTLENCECGGRFIQDGLPKCPRCLKPLDSDSIRDQLAADKAPFDELFKKEWVGWKASSFAVVEGLELRPRWRISGA